MQQQSCCWGYKTDFGGARMPDSMHLSCKHMLRLLVIAAIFGMSGAAFAQGAAPAPTAANAVPATAATPNAAQFAQVLTAIDQFSQQTNLDLARLRIEKWKTGSEHKDQAQ